MKFSGFMRLHLIKGWVKVENETLDIEIEITSVF